MEDSDKKVLNEIVQGYPSSEVFETLADIASDKVIILRRWRDLARSQEHRSYYRRHAAVWEFIAGRLRDSAKKLKQELKD